MREGEGEKRCDYFFHYIENDTALKLTFSLRLPLWLAIDRPAGVEIGFNWHLCCGRRMGPDALGRTQRKIRRRAAAMLAECFFIYFFPPK